LRFIPQNEFLSVSKFHQAALSFAVQKPRVARFAVFLCSSPPYQALAVPPIQAQNFFN
jgi:hypothetical protein